MSKERELLARVLESRTFMQGVALRRVIEQLLAQPELSTDSLQLDEQDLREDLREGLREDLREDPVAWMWTRNYEGGGYTNMVFQMRCEADEYAKDSESLKRPDLVRPLYLGETR